MKSLFYICLNVSRETCHVTFLFNYQMVALYLNNNAIIIIKTRINNEYLYINSELSGLRNYEKCIFLIQRNEAGDGEVAI